MRGSTRSGTLRWENFRRSHTSKLFSGQLETKFKPSFNCGYFNSSNFLLLDICFSKRNESHENTLWLIFLVDFNGPRKAFRFSSFKLDFEESDDCYCDRHTYCVPA